MPSRICIHISNLLTVKIDLFHLYARDKREVVIQPPNIEAAVYYSIEIDARPFCQHVEIRHIYIVHYHGESVDVPFRITAVDREHLRRGEDVKVME